MKFDQNSPTAHVDIYRFFKGVDLPGYVKEAEMPEEQELPVEAYACPDLQQFPINTPANVYISNAFLQEKQADIAKKFSKAFVEDVAIKIKEAAELFKITEDITAYTKAAEERANKDYALINVSTLEVEDAFGNKETVEFYPVKTAQDLEQAAEHFVKNINCYPFEWRQIMSDDFLKAAEVFKVGDLPELICKYAGLYFPATQSDIVAEIDRRSTKLAQDENKEIFNKLKEIVPQLEDLESYFKVASVIYQTEKKEGLYNNNKTAELLPDPVDMIFIYPTEKVAEILNVVKMGEDIFTMDSLKKVSAEVYKEAFGIDVNPTDTEKLAEVLPTMPLSDVALFKELTGLKSI